MIIAYVCVCTVFIVFGQGAKTNGVATILLIFPDIFFFLYIFK